MGARIYPFPFKQQRDNWVIKKMAKLNINDFIGTTINTINGLPRIVCLLFGVYGCFSARVRLRPRPSFICFQILNRVGCFVPKSPSGQGTNCPRGQGPKCPTAQKRKALSQLYGNKSKSQMDSCQMLQFCRTNKK